jgi:hypothetical protein
MVHPFEILRIIEPKPVARLIMVAFLRDPGAPQ